MSQIVLHKSGYDPDFRATKRFQIDVEPLIENLVKSGLSQSGISDEESKKIKQELEEALTAKQESEAKLSALQVSNLKIGVDKKCHRLLEVYGKNIHKHFLPLGRLSG